MYVSSDRIELLLRGARVQSFVRRSVTLSDLYIIYARAIRARECGNSYLLMYHDKIYLIIVVLRNFAIQYNSYEEINMSLVIGNPDVTQLH